MFSKNVFFTYSGFVDKDKIQDFKLYRAQYSKGKGADLAHAILQMDEYIADPIVS